MTSSTDTNSHVTCSIDTNSRVTCNTDMGFGVKPMQ